MKKVLSTFLSMRTANTLLALVALLCGLSSLLPQGRELPFYAENYPRAYVLIYRTHFYDVFGSWYFALLIGLLCLSMLLCTGRMLLRCLKGLRQTAEETAALPNAESLEPGQLEELRRWAASVRCREEKLGDTYVFRKNRLGYAGLFLLHLSILLTVLFGIFALVLPKVSDLDCRVGESVKLDDGTRIAVDSFRRYDESGKLDYASVVRITLPDGRQSPAQEIKVNYPMSFGGVKVFQWEYGVSGAVIASPQAQIIAYVDEEIEDEDAARALGEALLKLENVEAVEFVSRREAYEQLIRQDPSLTEVVDETAFRHRFVLSLKDVERIEETLAEAETIPGIAKAKADRYRALDVSPQRIDLREPAFLSGDGLSGLMFLGLYEGHPEGKEEETRAFYRIQAVSGGLEMPAVDILPGESLSVGGWDYVFQDPYYPGLRVKQMPFPYANSLLEAAMVLMLLGLFLCFFLQPVLVKADEKGYTVAGPRPERIRLELARRLQKEAEKK